MQILRKNIKHNFNTLIERQAEIVNEINQKLYGKVLKVLAEGVSKTNKDMLTGRTESGKIVNFNGDKSQIGQMLDIKITEIATWSLKGEIV